MKKQFKSEWSCNICQRDGGHYSKCPNNIPLKKEEIKNTIYTSLLAAFFIVMYHLYK